MTALTDSHQPGLLLLPCMDNALKKYYDHCGNRLHQEEGTYGPAGTIHG